MTGLDGFLSDLHRLWDSAGTGARAGTSRLITATSATIHGRPSAEDAAVLGIAMLALIALALVAALTQGRRIGPAPASPLSRTTRGARNFGYAIALAFFGLFGAWSWYAPLNSAAVAHGVVSPDGSRKTVQHLEGGIIKTIHVKEGAWVEAGEPLVTLDDVQARARLQELQERLTYLLASEARLVAEQTGAETIDFPPDLANDASDEARKARLSQKILFKDRRETQAARERILNKRVDQLNEQIVGLQNVIAEQGVQGSLIEKEIEITQGLRDKKLARLSPLLDLQRQLAGLKADRASNQASIARLRQQIGETELQLHATRQEAVQAVSEQLTQVRADLASVRSQLPERRDALARTVVRAPISGRVMNLRVTTEHGGILGSGGSILDIVPDGSELVIDARVRPKDIETVHPGMRARIILTAYTQRNLPQIFGELRTVSADRLVDQRTGEPYYLAKVFVDARQIKAANANLELIAGMPADVMILNGTRTVFDYLFKPFSDSILVAFREN